MMSTNNILSPANGKPIIVPTQDIVLGLYYLSLVIDDEPGQGMVFGDVNEVHQALAAGVVAPHARIRCRIHKIGADGELYPKVVETTPGRMMLYEILPHHVNVSFEGLLNRVLTKKEISQIIDEVYRHCGQKETVIFADRMMNLGFTNACKAGISFGKDDMIVPANKARLIGQTQEMVKQYEQQYADGLITKGEKYNKVVDAWQQCSDRVAEEMMQAIQAVQQAKTEQGRFHQPNAIWMMAHSGARGSAAQIKQLAGMRGLMAKPSGEIIETPIISNFKEGLTVLEYFNSTHGARKGLADTALKTANSGYLTRRLVDVAQDCIITEEDCGTTRFITITSSSAASAGAEDLGERVLGRTTAEDITNPRTGELVVPRGTLLDEELVRQVDKAGVDSAHVRSVLTCEAATGVCSACYGRDLARGTPVNIGEAVGVIAAQSIGEPGTQLTMRTFHIGGAAQASAEQSTVESPCAGQLRLVNPRIVRDSAERLVVLGRNTELVVYDEVGREKLRQKLPNGARLRVEPDAVVEKDQVLAEWDPHTLPVLTETKGKIVFQDMIEGVSFREVVDETTGKTSKEIIDWRQVARAGNLRPSLLLQDEAGNPINLASGNEARYYLPVSAILSVDNGQPVSGGDILARLPREASKTRDITGGLPRVAELFEARRPKDPAIIAETEGRIEFGKDYKNKRRLRILPVDEIARAGRVPDPQGPARGRPGGRQREAGRSDRRRQSGAARPLARPGRRGAGAVPGQRDPGGLSAPGREDQRQAHRGDRPPDAAEDRDRRSRRHDVPRGRAGRQDRVRPAQRALHHRGQAGRHLLPGPAGDHQGQPADPVLHLGRLLPGDDPRAHRGGVRRQGRQAARAEGERDRRPPDPGRHGRCPAALQEAGGGRRAL